MMDQMMPPGMPPGGAPMGPPMEAPMETPPDLPERAKVLKVEGQMVILKTDDGQELQVPIEAFVFPPEQGADLVQAQVVRIEGNMMVVSLEGQEVEVPITEGFNEGDFFWMPAPPMGPAEDLPMGGEIEQETLL